MPLHQPSLKRLIESEMRGEALGLIFEALYQTLQASGLANARIQLDWVDPDDETEEGQLYPIFTFELSPTNPRRKADNLAISERKEA